MGLATAVRSCDWRPHLGRWYCRRCGLTLPGSPVPPYAACGGARSAAGPATAQDPVSLALAHAGRLRASGAAIPVDRELLEAIRACRNSGCRYYRQDGCRRAGCGCRATQRWVELLVAGCTGPE